MCPLFWPKSLSPLVPKSFLCHLTQERMSLMSEDYFTASTFYPITYKIIKGRPKRQQTFAEAIRSTDATNKVDYPPLSLASQSSSQISLSNKFSPLSSITENPTESGPSTTNFHYKKPNSNTNNRTQSKAYQPSLPGTKQNLNKPRETNLAKSKPQVYLKLSESASNLSWMIK
jgi:hypothetical protein